MIRILVTHSPASHVLLFCSHCMLTSPEHHLGFINENPCLATWNPFVHLKANYLHQKMLPGKTGSMLKLN